MSGEGASYGEDLAATIWMLTGAGCAVYVDALYLMACWRTDADDGADAFVMLLGGSRRATQLVPEGSPAARASLGKWIVAGPRSPSVAVL